MPRTGRYGLSRPSGPRWRLVVSQPVARIAIEESVRGRRDVMSDWNNKIIEEFRANGGQVGGQFTGAAAAVAHGTRQERPASRQPGDVPEGRRRLRHVRVQGRCSTNPDRYYNLLAPSTGPSGDRYRQGRSLGLVTAASSDTTTASGRTLGAVIGPGIACSTSWWGRWPSVHRWDGQRRFSSCHQTELFGRIVRVHRRSLGSHEATGVGQVRTCHRSLGQPVHSVESLSATVR
jgi:hypothetical protein